MTAAVDPGRGLEIAPDVFEHDDADSGLNSEGTSHTSLRSSILAYHQENGRTYHALSAGKYFIPNDASELDRLDLQHTLFLLTLDDELCLCPKKNGAKRVLDVGTGSGIWAIDYADAHPEAEVTGVDLSPTQPQFVPPNCIFEIDDIEKEWLWTKPFDFIFARMLGGSLAKPQDFMHKAYNNLEPGGWLEMTDMVLPVMSDDGSLAHDSHLAVMSHMTMEAAARSGRPIDLAPEYEAMMEAAGFVDVEMRTFKWPSNIWPRDNKYKNIGRWNFANIDGGLEGLTLALFTRTLGLTKEETMLLCAGARREIRDPSIHAYWTICVCYGKKPEANKK